MKLFTTFILLLILLNLLGTVDAIMHLRSNRRGKSHGTPEEKKNEERAVDSNKKAIEEVKKIPSESSLSDVNMETNSESSLDPAIRLALSSSGNKLSQNSTNSSSSALENGTNNSSATNSSSPADSAQNSQANTGSSASSSKENKSDFPADLSANNTANNSSNSSDSNSSNSSSETPGNRSLIQFEDVVMVQKISPYAKEDLNAISRNEELKALGGGLLPTYLVSDKVFDETPLIYVDVLKTKVTGAGRPNDDRKIDHLWAGWLGDRLYKNVSYEDPDIPSTDKINADLDEAFNLLKKKAAKPVSNSTTPKLDVILDDIVNPLKRNMFETHTNTTVAYNEILKNLAENQKKDLNIVESPKKESA